MLQLVQVADAVKSVGGGCSLAEDAPVAVVSIGRLYHDAAEEVGVAVACGVADCDIAKQYWAYGVVGYTPVDIAVGGDEVEEVVAALVAVGD